MKNILIFRSARHMIVKNCIRKLQNEEDAKFWLCVQEECADSYSDDNVELMIFPNGFFDYESVSNMNELVQQLQDRKYDMVYCPYSTTEPDCLEIEKITKNILKQKNLYYYSGSGEITPKKLHRIHINSQILDNIIDEISYIIFRLIYIFFSFGKVRK